MTSALMLLLVWEERSGREKRGARNLVVRVVNQLVYLFGWQIIFVLSFSFFCFHCL